MGCGLCIYLCHHSLQPATPLSLQEVEGWPAEAADAAIQGVLRGPGAWGRSRASSASEWRCLAVLPVHLLAWLAQVRDEITPENVTHISIFEVLSLKVNVIQAVNPSSAGAWTCAMSFAVFTVAKLCCLGVLPVHLLGGSDGTPFGKRGLSDLLGACTMA